MTGHNRAHRLTAFVVACILLTAIALSHNAYAGSAGLSLQVGGSQESWSDSPPALFSRTAFVPGDDVVADVAARNDSDEAGKLTLAASHVAERGGVLGLTGTYGCDVADGIADQLTVQVWQVTGSSRDLVYDDDVCSLQTQPVLLTSALASGGITHYAVEASLPRATGNDVQGASASWVFNWQLTDSTGNGIGQATTRVLGEKVTSGGLPFTGFDAIEWAATALLLLLFGAFIALLASGRRRSRDVVA